MVGRLCGRMQSVSVVLTNKDNNGKLHIIHVFCSAVVHVQGLLYFLAVSSVGYSKGSRMFQKLNLFLTSQDKEGLTCSFLSVQNS